MIVVELVAFATQPRPSAAMQADVVEVRLDATGAYRKPRGITVNGVVTVLKYVPSKNRLALRSASGLIAASGDRCQFKLNWVAVSSNSVLPFFWARKTR